ncbi:MAG TPA: protein TolR [Rhodocyclaceae bacterium]|nr:protein TolR [Rhodocyclaceae bacterium]
MRQRRLKNEINVVPYIDVMLVLLVIFMVTTPMMMTGSIDLPTVGKAEQTPAKPIEIMIKADRQLAVREARNVERPLAREELVKYVKAAQAKEPNRPVVIAGDKNVKYEAVLDVMDQLQRAQVARVGLLVQPTGK